MSSSTERLILGIDPGYATTGYGVVAVTGQKLLAVDYGVIRTSADQRFSERVLAIYEGVRTLLERFRPGEVALEELFFARNTTTALGTAQARGVCLLAAEQAGLMLLEYTPAQVKMSVTGNGRAEKVQVQEMVRLLLNLKEIPRPDDAADALAVAICQAHIGNELGREIFGGYQNRRRDM